MRLTSKLQHSISRKISQLTRTVASDRVRSTDRRNSELKVYKILRGPKYAFQTYGGIVIPDSRSVSSSIS